GALLRALRAAVDPRLDQFSEHLLAARRRLASFARLPAPGDEVVFRHVLVQELEIAAAVARRILDLPADLADRFPLPRHLERRHAPARMSGDAAVRRALVQREVMLRMTGAAGIAGDPEAGLAAHHRRPMLVPVVALG